jgi:pseudouridine kinase
MNAEVICFGGAHIDCSAYSVGPVVPGASNPVRRRTSVGGVARNVAVRLAAAGVRTALVSRVGTDSEARAVLDDLERHGVDCRGVQRDDEHPTAYYTALIDPSGELAVGWADMDVYEALTPATLASDIGEQARHSEYAGARGWFIDSNLPAATLDWIAAHRPAGAWLAADTISPAKARRLTGVLPRLDYLFCNRLAAATLLDIDIEQQATSELARALTALGVGTAIVTDGPRGLALATAGRVRELPPPVDEVTGDVTGAGDSLVAGTLAGLARGEAIDDAILRGLAAARITLSKRGA